MGRKLGIDGQAVAYAVIENVLTEDATNTLWDNADVIGIAHHLIEAADVEFQPRARKLILTFDLAEPDEQPAAAFVDDEPVPYVPAAADDLPQAGKDVAL